MRATILVLALAGISCTACASWPGTHSSPAAVPRGAPPDARVAQSSRGRGNDGLPPGIARNLERGKPLPPGLAKRRVPPAELRKLPPARDGFEYVVVAGKIVLIETATQVVHDILTDLLL